jgi:hypothetical protein
MFPIGKDCAMHTVAKSRNKMMLIAHRTMKCTKSTVCKVFKNKSLLGNIPPNR